MLSKIEVSVDELDKQLIQLRLLEQKKGMTQ